MLDARDQEQAWELSRWAESDDLGAVAGPVLRGPEAVEESRRVLAWATGEEKSSAGAR